MDDKKKKYNKLDKKLTEISLASIAKEDDIYFEEWIKRTFEVKKIA